MPKKVFKNRYMWSKEDLMIAYYIACYGTSGLLSEEIEVIAKYVIGVSAHSLSMQIANFRSILDLPGYQLSDTKFDQHEVVNEFKNVDRLDLRSMVNGVIVSSDTQKNINEFHKQKIAQDRERFKRESEERLHATLSRFASLGRKLKPLNK